MYNLEVYDNNTNTWIIKNNAFLVKPIDYTKSWRAGESLSVFIPENDQNEFDAYSCLWGLADLRLTSNNYPNTVINVPNNSYNWTYNKAVVNDYGFYTNINIPHMITFII